MLSAFAIILIIGLAVGGDFLTFGGKFEFKRCIFSLRFLKKLIFQSVVSILLFMAVYHDYFVILNMSWYKLLMLGGIAIGVVLVSVLFTALKDSKSSKIWYAAIICLVCVVAAETFLFNSRAIQSHEYDRVEVLSLGNITSSGKGENGSYHINKGKTAVFEVTDISSEIKNLHLDIVMVNDKGEQIPYSVKIEATDKANELYITSMPSRKVYSGTSSEYVPMQLRGVSDKLKITITPDSSVEADMYVRDISLNTPKPFAFDMARMLMIFALAFLFYLISPASPAHDRKLNEKGKWYSGTTALVITLEIMMIFAIIASSSHYLELIAKHQAQYQQLAESFLNGKLYLEQEVPQFLLDMENPYDYALRRAQGQAYYWDAALFGGHYYVYFGVVPCLLTYLPYYVLTGQHLSNDISLFIFAIFFIIGCFSFIKQVIKRYFPDSKISYVSYLIISLLVVNGSGLLFMASYADMYSVPIMAALAFTSCGLALWLSALNNKRARVFKLALGSLCMALVAGCRPNLLLFSALAIPFFIAEVIKAIKEKKIFDRVSIKNTLAFAIPYVVVAAGIMWYNYARFGSPFDFGSNYNLTTNDMTSRGFVWDRMFPAIYSYLFQLPKMTASFPFIRYADFDTTYMGVTIRESTYGGIFSYSPLLWLIFVIPFVKDVLKKSRVYAPVLILTAIGFITPLLDAQFAGILQRYFADFSLMLYLAATLILLALINHFKEEKHRKVVHRALFVCAIAMFVYQSTLVMRTVDMVNFLPYMFWY
ncbi:MAG: hypothetical protein E7577_06895 [Ruminococcaceae bacterium]|nr:hypothetical protein [Oscillospiraceae bacterium]